MTDRGVYAAGAYAPSLRLDADAVEQAWDRFEAAGIETTAVPDADEDAVTMGWEAARRALDAAELTGEAVDWLAFATTTPPVEESDCTATLGSALGVPERAARRTFTGSTRAGTQALAAALDARLDDGLALVIASDCPRGHPQDERDHAAGAGAAAVLVGPDAPAPIIDSAEYTTPYPGTRFRRTGSEHVDGIDVKQYDRDAFTAPLDGATDALSVDLSTLDAVAVQAPDGALPYRAARGLGVDTEAISRCSTVDHLGDTAAASVLLSVAVALDDGADRILAAGYGSGAGADAHLIDPAAAVPTSIAIHDGEHISYTDYLRRREVITKGPPDGGGAYVSVPAWRRSIPQRHRLVAGQCAECGALAFPPAGACSDCGSLDAFAAVELPPGGTVETGTAIGRGGEPPEFAVQQAASGTYGVAIVEFDHDGEQVSVPLQVTGVDPAPEIGDRVRTVLRRCYEQEGVVRYARKAQLAQ